MLPLYLPIKTNKDDYDKIKTLAIECYKAMIHKSISNKGVIKPMQIIKDTLNNSKYGENIAKGINKVLIDNYAIYVPEDQKEVNKNKNIEDIEFTVHDFVRYVYSDTKFFESEK